MDWQVLVSDTMGGFQVRLREALARLSRSAEASLLLKQSVGTSTTKIPHGLGRVPAGVRIGVPNADARVWQAQDADRTFVYLRASVAVKVDVEVF